MYKLYYFIGFILDKLRFKFDCIGKWQSTLSLYQWFMRKSLSKNGKYCAYHYLLSYQGEYMYLPGCQQNVDCDPAKIKNYNICPYCKKEIKLYGRLNEY